MLAVEKVRDCDTIVFNREIELMRFRLVYDGPLPPSQEGEERTVWQQKIRRQLRPQFEELFRTHPTLEQRLTFKQPTRYEPSEDTAWPITFAVGEFEFLPFVTKPHWMTCHLDILFLRRAAAGQLIFPGGDLDNRIKTLLDALRMPQQMGQLPPDDHPKDGEKPFYCLLQDDSLVTGLSILSDRLLEPGHERDVRLIIGVKVFISRLSPPMIRFIGD